MKNKPLFIVLFITLLAILLAGCDSKTPAEKIYWEYFEACNRGDFTTAKNYVAENALNPESGLGVCAFTHDAINTYEAQSGNPARTFSQDPMVNANDKVTSITWIDDQGNIASIVLVDIDGEWKVTEATWSR